ncbi:TPA: hypothetical protein MED75_004387 [Klebsiella variicola]|nr:hypothetical protein [Klebsiella variicola]NSM86769.1 hypothetical protein [Klebsiella variicola]QIS52421.1 hypothetical protein GSY73_17675 [Klebsiella variicola]HBW0857472.1 hypothetical protein [Klebsiella variicola]HBW0864191.1 hypothetical protein [Klebsiella variicola]
MDRSAGQAPGFGARVDELPPATQPLSNPASTSAIAPCLNVIFAILIVISQEISADFQIISKGYNIPARQQTKKSPPTAGS